MQLPTQKALVPVVRLHLLGPQCQYEVHKFPQTDVALQAGGPGAPMIRSFSASPLPSARWK
jgi:hypothetical protein